jgi:hypothetical protein
MTTTFCTATFAADTPTTPAEPPKTALPARMPPKAEPLALEGSATTVRRWTSAMLLPPNETLLAPAHLYIAED